MLADHILVQLRHNLARGQLIENLVGFLRYSG